MRPPHLRQTVTSTANTRVRRLAQPMRRGALDSARPRCSLLGPEIDVELTGELAEVVGEGGEVRLPGGHAVEGQGDADREVGRAPAAARLAAGRRVEPAGRPSRPGPGRTR